MTMTRSSFPARILAAVKRAEAMVACDSGDDCISERRRAGWTKGSYCIIEASVSLLRTLPGARPV